DFERNQTNRLIRFFSNEEPSVYYLKPTEVAMQRYESQLRYDGHTRGDQYRGINYTYYFQNGEWVIRKFSRDRESAAEIYKNNVHIRSEEHTSELQSRENLVCRLLLEKKKETTDSM